MLVMLMLIVMMMIVVMITGCGKYESITETVVDKLNLSLCSKGNQSPGIPFGKMRRYFYLMFIGSCKDCSALDYN